MSLLKIKRDVKNFINYFLDIILALSIIVTLASSYMLWFVLPGRVARTLECAHRKAGVLAVTIILFWMCPDTCGLRRTTGRP